MFMADMDGVRRYVEMLQTTSRAVTTANFYLRNVAQFLGYFKETKPSLCRLSQTQIVAVERCILKALRDLRKRVTLHQVEVKRVKMARVVTVSNLQRCHHGAKAKIPSLLDELEEDGEASRYHFYGYFAAFVSSLYGHRPGVITNMLLKELYLQKDEFAWLERWVSMRPKIKPKAQNYLVFFTAGKGPMKNLNGYFQQAWAEMGLPGKPTFTDVRTAVSAHGKNLHSAEERAEMAKYMCHDEATADKFYALSLNAKQSAEMRRRFEATLQSGKDEDEGKAGPSPTEPKILPPRKRTRKTVRDSSSEEEGECIRSGYERCTTRIAIGGELSEPMATTRGVRQGDPLSPLLFNLAMDPLLCPLSTEGKGVSVGGLNVAALAFADDLVLLSDSWGGMSHNLEITAAFCRVSYRLTHGDVGIADLEELDRVVRVESEDRTVRILAWEVEGLSGFTKRWVKAGGDRGSMPDLTPFRPMPENILDGGDIQPPVPKLAWRSPVDWRGGEFHDWCSKRVQGVSIDGFKHSPEANSWLMQTSGVPCKWYANAVRLRAGVWPTKEFLSRGQSKARAYCRTCPG
ncbi:hypothetical protein ACEWY4_001493 [Coilia grayii]|uniref:Reverse transcriptase domain-containing protein n=1 Tax=Coilia grayii TaxID=363190 RepID=A0ABD1KT33_9TELE